MKQTLCCFSFWFFFLIISFKSVNVSAQTGDNKPSLDKGTIESQFNYLISASSKYEDYKVVKEGWLWTLRSHVTDSLKALHKELRNTQNIGDNKSVVIDSLKAEVTKLTSQYEEMYKEKNSLRFLGMLMSKGSYNGLMWTIVIGLLILLLIFIFLFKRTNVVTIQTKQDLQELKDEFEAHRKRALEREEKLARQYMNELKKYKN